MFFETLASPDLAESLAGDIGVTTAVLDPIEGLSSRRPGTRLPDPDAAEPGRAREKQATAS